MPTYSRKRKLRLPTVGSKCYAKMLRCNCFLGETPVCAPGVHNFLGYERLWVRFPTLTPNCSGGGRKQMSLIGPLSVAVIGRNRAIIPPLTSHTRSRRQVAFIVD